MRILFDHGVPSGIATFLKGHEVTEAENSGWEALSKAELVAKAETAGFELLLTNDRQIRSQLNLKDRKIAIVLIADPLRLKVRKLAEVINEAKPGSYTEVGAAF